jgi:deazaflavin-dependent oxidoreductase (nitroreductase family)
MNGVQKTIFRVLTKLNVAVYRRSGGRFMNKANSGIPVLLLTVLGRSTGRPRTNPVGYLEDSGSYAVTGTANGAPQEPQWFRNLRATDRANILVGQQHHDVTVRIAEGEERDRLWNQIVARYPGFAAYEKKSPDRPMPVAVLTPTD